jgi:hypothetical protein
MESTVAPAVLEFKTILAVPKIIDLAVDTLLTKVYVVKVNPFKFKLPVDN